MEEETNDKNTCDPKAEFYAHIADSDVMTEIFTQDELLPPERAIPVLMGSVSLYMPTIDHWLLALPLMPVVVEGSPLLQLLWRKPVAATPRVDCYTVLRQLRLWYEFITQTLGLPAEAKGRLLMWELFKSTHTVLCRETIERYVLQELPRVSGSEEAFMASQRVLAVRLINICEWSLMNFMNFPFRPELRRQFFSTQCSNEQTPLVAAAQSKLLSAVQWVNEYKPRYLLEDENAPPIWQGEGTPTVSQFTESFCAFLTARE